MTGLAEFLLARIAEDEALIGPAVNDTFYGQPGALIRWDHEVDVNFPRLAAECKAKRRIVELSVEYLDPDASPYYAEQVLLLLALPYADHPDYREEWRP